MAFDKDAKRFNKARIVFSTNGADVTAYPNAKK